MEELIPRLTKLAKKLNREDIVHSVCLVGSYSSEDYDKHSDCDLLIVFEKQFTPMQARSIGSIIHSNLPNSERFVFHNPVCEKCIYPSETFKLHIIPHVLSDLNKWMNSGDFVMCSWARNHKVLAGKTPFSSVPLPKLNSSLLDNWDGIPGFSNQINLILITKDPTIDSFEYSRNLRFFGKRYEELHKCFPSLFTEDIVFKKDLDLIGLSEEFEKLGERVKFLLSIS